MTVRMTRSVASITGKENARREKYVNRDCSRCRTSKLLSSNSKVLSNFPMKRFNMPREMPDVGCQGSYRRWTFNCIRRESYFASA